MRADEQRTEQQDEAVDRDPVHQPPTYGDTVMTGQGEKDRRAADRVHNGEQPGIDQEERVRGGVHGERIVHLAPRSASLSEEAADDDRFLLLADAERVEGLD